MSKSWRALAAVAATLALLGPASGQALKDVSIGYTPSLTGAMARVTEELGLFEKHGLKVKLTQMPTANATATGIVSRSVDAALSGAGELVAAQARGIDMVLVANLYNGLSATLVLSKAAADKLGVSPTAPVAERLKALDGLTIASTTATSLFTVTIKSAVDSVGARPRFVYMDQPSMLAALESGSVQGYMASAPFWLTPTVNGSGVVWISGPKGEFPRESTPSSSANILMMRDFIVANPDIAKGVAAAFADLARAFGERPAEVKDAIRRAFPSLTKESIDLLYPQESLGFMAKPLTPADMARDIDYVKLGNPNLPNIDKLNPRNLLYP